MPSIRARVDQALDLIASFVRIAYRTAIFLIVTVAFLLSLLFFHIYPLAIIPILILAALAILYVNSKKHAITELIEDADEESAIPREAQHSRHVSARALPKRIVLRLLDQVLGSASDTVMLVPLVCAVVAIVAFIANYNTVGFVLAFIAVTLFLILACSCHLVEYFSHRWVERLFGDAQGENTAAKAEATPLLPGGKR